jgi:multimeric flavodoxin WrbA
MDDKMNVTAINGGPRKTGNTAQMLEGASESGAETELVCLRI